MNDRQPTRSDAPGRRALLRASTAGVAGALAGCWTNETDDLCGVDPPPTEGPAAVRAMDGPLDVSPDATWPMVGYDAGRTGNNPAPSMPEDPGVRWRFETREPPERGRRVPQRPVVDGYRVYLVNAHRELVALDAREGSLRWRLTDPRLRTDHPPAVDDDLLYVGGRAGLFAVTPDGDERWRYAPDDVPTRPTPTPANGTPLPDGSLERRGFGGPLVAGGTVYAASARGVHAVDAATGEERWRTAGVDLTAVAGDRVLAFDGHLLALRTADGRERWRAPEAAYSAAAVRDGRVYAGELKRVHCFDLTSGRREWRFEGETELFGSPAVGRDRVYAPSSVTEAGDGGNLYALDPESGDPQWCEYLGFTAVRQPAVADGTVHVPTEQGLFAALDARDGSVAWSFSSEDASFESVAAVDGGVILGGRGEVWGVG